MPYNVAMSHPQIIIPFSLPPAEHARDLVKLLASECTADGLAMLLSRARSLQRRHYDDFSLELPHEVWLSEQYSQFSQLQKRCNLTLPDGYWFVLNPVNLHIASNHVVLTDYRQLELSEHEARTLYEIARTNCRAAGLELVYGDATHWFLRADDWSDFATASPDAACGHNIEIWSPKGTRAISWRKLQNEIQMEWFIHPLQEQRQARGAKVINGLWLWCGTEVKRDDQAESAASAGTNLSVADYLQTPRLTLLDQLCSAALANDWAGWALTMKELDQTWFVPLCAALKARQVQHVNLILTNSNALLDVQASSNSLRRFWRHAHFSNLI